MNHSPRSGSDAALPSLRWTRVDVDPPEPVEFSVEEGPNPPSWVRPSAPLIEGARYRLEVDASCSPTASEFTAGPAEDLPTELGSVKLGGLSTTELTVGTSSGSCTTQADAAVIRAELMPSAQSRPWAELLVFRSRVDGAVYWPNHDYGPTSTLYALCDVDSDTFPGLTQGSHALVFEAELPGDDRTLETPSVGFALRCEDGGCSAAGGPRSPAASAGSVGLCALALVALSRRRRVASRQRSGRDQAA